MLIKMKKKGVSPLVATVLLIAIVIIIAILIWFWYNQYLKELGEKTDTQLAQQCTNAEMQIKSITCSDTTNTSGSEIYRLNFDIANTGSSRIASLLIIAKNPVTSTSKQTPGVIAEGTASEFSIDILKADLISITELEIIPIVKSGLTSKNCEAQAEFSEEFICASP
jgi:flagellin-like protein